LPRLEVPAHLRDCAEPLEVQAPLVLLGRVAPQAILPDQRLRLRRVRPAEFVRYPGRRGRAGRTGETQGCHQEAPLPRTPIRAGSGRSATAALPFTDTATFPPATLNSIRFHPSAWIASPGIVAGRPSPSSATGAASSLLSLSFSQSATSVKSPGATARLNSPF